MNRIIRSTALAAALVSGALLLTACGGDDKAEDKKPAASAKPTPKPSPTDTRSEAEKAWDETMKSNDDNREKFDREAAEAAAADPNSTETAELPDVVGIDMDSAQDLLKVFGFNYVVDEDQTGQDRLQILDNEWKVCTQDPAPGTERVEVLVTLTAVKMGETCS